MTQTARASSTEWIRRPWPDLLVLGVINVALGVLAISWPGPTVGVATVILGIHLIISGAAGAVSAVRSRSDVPWPGIVLGSVSMVAGVLVMRQPIRSLALVVALIGIVWMFWGVVTLFLVLADRVRGQRRDGLGEAIIHLLGGAAVLTWPVDAVRTLTLVAGVFLVVFGLYAAVSALRTRSSPSID